MTSDNDVSRPSARTFFDARRQHSSEAMLAITMMRGGLVMEGPILIWRYRQAGRARAMAAPQNMPIDAIFPETSTKEGFVRLPISPYYPAGHSKRVVRKSAA